ncbi:MAG: rRNA maturation RNase YbeY [Fibrobacterota bacterium]
MKNNSDQTSPLTIVSEDGSIPVHTEALHVIADNIYTGEGIKRHQGVDLIFCSEGTIRRLNGMSRNKDSVTDVLSYPFNDPDFLGEIYICTTAAKEQAREYNFTPEEEVSRLFTHGLVHLLGYDHLTESERSEMETVEERYFTIPR